MMNPSISIFLSIEGIPVIIRFKTPLISFLSNTCRISIEGIPVIIRFKTALVSSCTSVGAGIEGIPVIIRFKTYGAI